MNDLPRATSKRLALPISFPTGEYILLYVYVFDAGHAYLSYVGHTFQCNFLTLAGGVILQAAPPPEAHEAWLGG